jgi:hypothetical protein
VFRFPTGKKDVPLLPRLRMGCGPIHPPIQLVLMDYFPGSVGIIQSDLQIYLLDTDSIIYHLCCFHYNQTIAQLYIITVFLYIINILYREILL